MRRALPLLVGVGLLLAAAGGVPLLVGGDDTAETPSGAPMARVVVPDLSAEAGRGRGLFDDACAVCHGENAAGRDGIAPPLVHVIYEPGHHADGAFFLAAARGVRQHHWSFGDMPAVPDVTPQEVAAIIAYVRALQRANGIY